MPSSTLPAPPPSRHREWTTAPIAKMAVLFWLFSYVLFTSRVQLRGDEGLAALFTARRLLTTVAGALLYAGVLRFAIFPAGRRPAHPLVLVLAVIPAAAAMVLFRALVDPLVSAEPPAMADHLRWVLVWAGYFGVWLIGFQAWRMCADSSRTESVAAVPRGRLVTTASPPHVIVEKVFEAIADEVAQLPEPERRALLRRLAAHYEVADDPLGTETLRAAMIGRIAGRIVA